MIVSKQLCNWPIEIVGSDLLDGVLSSMEWYKWIYGIGEI